MEAQTSGPKESRSMVTAAAAVCTVKFKRNLELEGGGAEVEAIITQPGKFNVPLKVGTALHHPVAWRKLVNG